MATVDLLPDRLQAVPELRIQLGAYDPLLDAFDDKVAWFLSQLFVFTADTVGLAWWEARYSLTATSTLTDEVRRARVLAKMQGTRTTTADVIAELVQQYTGQSCKVVENYADYSISIVLTGDFGRPSGISACQQAVREMLPAHLGFSIYFRYLLVGEVHGMTIGTLCDTPLTHFVDFGEEAV